MGRDRSLKDGEALSPPSRRYDRSASPPRKRERAREKDADYRRSRSRSREPVRRSRSRDRGTRKRSRSRERDERQRSQSKDRPRRERSPELPRASRSYSKENGNREEEGAGERAGVRDARREVKSEHDEEVEESRAAEEANGGVHGEGKASGKKAEPLSLEEILKKKKAEALQQAKPVFLTKAQREALALQRLEESAAAQRAKAEEQRRVFAPILANGAAKPEDRPDRDKDRSDRDQERERDRERDRHRERERERERERDRERDRRDRDRDRERGAGDRPDRERDRRERERGRQEVAAVKEKERELEAIKEQYLGVKKAKKRVVKPSEKFRFSFDWENGDDTSRDLNPIYQNPHEAQLLFGRGFRAGVDRREQKKLAAKNEAAMRAAAAAKEGREENAEDKAAAVEREAAANAYDSFDMRVDRHWSEKKLEEMNERDWRIFREDFNIAYKGSRIPRPMRSWEESKLAPQLLRAVKEAGYTKPSPIQMAAIPIGLQQRDVIGIAETGSGKTCAFVLPMLTYISKLPPMNETNEAEGPYAVIMAPTRELAQQIEEETVKFAEFLDLRVVSIVGGQSIEEQGFKLRQGCEIVIATPGRLGDCLDKRYAVLNQCNYVVLDEADRMIDMGFEPQVQAVLEAMPSSNLKPENEDEELEASRIYRTTYMFSATMPPSVERLARKFMRNPVVVTIGTAGKVTDKVTQHVFMVKEPEKFDRLNRILHDLGADKTAIVFVNQKKHCDGLFRQLEKNGWKVTSLHGGKTQEQREVSLEGFRQKRYNILIATDVAGRGIDIPDVAHVVNYDMPGNIEQYTHRIGRTGRAGKTGVATTFLTMYDTEVFYDLKQMLTDSSAAVPPELARHEAAKFKPGSIPDRPSRKNEQVFAH